MNCPRCNVKVAFAKKRCDNCGQDLTNHRMVISMSNQYYNTALEQAKVRDLSGAIRSLRQSLEFNKMNTNARNLLGLIYYEEGEVVSALSEWVISTNFQTKYNDAEGYIRAVQENPNKLDMYNQTIKKYNTALNSAKNGDEDMAIIQLKKVVGLNPKFIRANQLLALLYMMTGRRDNKLRAKKLLLNIQKIDVTNTTTIRYLNELKDVHVKGEEAPKKVAAEPPKPEPVKTLPKVEQDAYKIITPYKEEKPSVLPFINVIVGVIIGMALMGFLIMPHINASRLQKENENFKKYSETKVANDSDVSSLKAQIEELNKEKAALEKENKELQGDENGATMKDSYESLLAAIQAFENGDKVLAAESLAKVNEAIMTSETAKAVFDKIKEETYMEMSNSVFEQGRDAYNGEGEYAGKRDYVKAVELLEKALSYNRDNTDAMYFLGRCYQQQSQMEKAQEYYNQIINNYPDSPRVTEAQTRLRELGVR